MRIDYGSGYRVSYTIRRRVVVILLAGGIKKTQTRDIKRGHEILAGLDEWRKKENPLLAVFPGRHGGCGRCTLCRQTSFFHKQK
ncbi:MAG: hypothetical protein IJS87_03935 [Rhodocyclaceae bacterium]|nr:hypothetical protein [Rhodocyclaceae bacterium]